jgi:hypothetical protein
MVILNFKDETMAQNRSTGYIQTYTRRARDSLLQIKDKYFTNLGLGRYPAMIFPCIDELIKNAIKANYKYVLIRDRIADTMAEEQPHRDRESIEQEVSSIVNNPSRFNARAEEILENHQISAEVRELLNEESKFINIKNRAYLEERDLTPDEKKEIESMKKLAAMRKRIRDLDIRVILKIQHDEDHIHIEITNTAPILQRDLDRITEKRSEYDRCRREEREHEFFINNLDTSESGFGLGYATIDSTLAGLGLEPTESLKILSAADTTVMLSLPVKELKEQPAMA